jgi:hypothetical protein
VLPKLTNDKTDTEDDILAKLLNEQLLPIEAKLNVDKALPARKNPLSDTDEDMSTNDNTLIASPMRAEPTADKHEPIFEKHLTLRADPNCTASKVDN